MNPPPLSRNAAGSLASGPAQSAPSAIIPQASSTPSQLARQAASPRLRRQPTSEAATPRSSRLRQEVFSAESPDGGENERDMEVDDK